MDEKNQVPSEQNTEGMSAAPEITVDSAPSVSDGVVADSNKMLKVVLITLAAIVGVVALVWGGTAFARVAIAQSGPFQAGGMMQQVQQETQYGYGMMGRGYDDNSDQGGRGLCLKRGDQNVDRGERGNCGAGLGPDQCPYFDSEAPFENGQGMGRGYGDRDGNGNGQGQSQDQGRGQQRGQGRLSL